jgi:eukaryotic-like serine/threonine-protein kinase
MTRDRQRQIEALQRAVLGKDPKARHAFLADICKGDEALRLDVERLVSRALAYTHIRGVAAKGSETIQPHELTKRFSSMPDAQNRELPETFMGKRFTVQRLIGAGGMGRVYEVYDNARRMRVALKTFQNSDSTALYLFKQEFRSLADVAHPNLVTLYELFSENAQVFFTMQFVDGVDFLSYVWVSDVSDTVGSSLTSESTARAEASGISETITVSAPFTEMYAVRPSPCALPRLREALRQLCFGVNALHALDKLHRDIKPSNVKVTAEPSVVLLDFGLVAEMRGGSKPGAHPEFVGGTLPYMSPEQAAGERLTNASDCYSIGVMLYQALTGQLPFQGSASDILRQKQRAAPRRPSLCATGIPDDLERLCLDLLARDPAHRPTGTDVLRSLSGTPPIDVTTTSAAPPHDSSLFVGRTQPLAVLSEALAAADKCQTVRVVIRGRSGIGKTELAAHFLNDLADRDDVVILAGRCFEQETVPYKALDGLIDRLSRYLVQLPYADAAELLSRDVAPLAQIFPVLLRVPAIANAPRRRLDDLDQPELRRRAVSGLRDLLARLGDRSRLVMHIDDLQWGDVDSAGLLLDVVSGPDAPAMMLIAGFRSDDAEESACLKMFLGDRARDAFSARFDIMVDALSYSEAKYLADSLLQGYAVPEDRIDEIARESGGNPYFIRELVAGVSTEIVNAEHAEAGSRTLDDLIWNRVCGISTEARRLLEVVAVSGRPLLFGNAVTVSETRSSLAAVAQLRAAHLVRTTGSGHVARLETYHDRIREAVIAHLSEERLLAVHGRLATTLASTRNADDEAIGFHYEHAGDFETAGRHYTMAGDRAGTALAFNRAVALYERALQLLRLGDKARRDLKLKLCEALANGGRGIEAARAYDDIAGEVPEPEALELRRRAAYYYCSSGHVDEGNQAFSKVLREVHMHLPQTAVSKLCGLFAVRARLRARGLRFRLRNESSVSRQTLQRIDIAWSVGTGLGLIDLSTGWQFTSRSLLLALQVGEPFRIARALAWEAATSASMSLAGQRRARTYLEQCDALVHNLERPYGRAMLALATGLVEYSSGGWLKARALLAEAEEIFDNECPGTSWELATVHAFQLRNLLMLGDYPELRLRGREWLQRAEQTGDLYYATYHGVFIEPHLRLLADQPNEARQSVVDALARWSKGAYHVQHALAAEALPTIELYDGNAQAAVHSLRAQWPLMKKSFMLRNLVYRRGVLELRARAAITAARAYDAERNVHLRAAERDAQSLEHLGQPCLQPFIHLLQAGAAATRGERNTATVLLTRAGEGFALAGLDGLLAATRRTLGLLCGGPQGQAMIRTAEDWMSGHHVANPQKFTAMLVAGCAEAAAMSQPSARAQFR